MEPVPELRTEPVPELRTEPVPELRTEPVPVLPLQAEPRPRPRPSAGQSICPADPPGEWRPVEARWVQPIPSEGPNAAVYKGSPSARPPEANTPAEWPSAVLSLRGRTALAEVNMSSGQIRMWLELYHMERRARNACPPAAYGYPRRRMDTPVSWGLQADMPWMVPTAQVQLAAHMSVVVCKPEAYMPVVPALP